MDHGEPLVVLSFSNGINITGLLEPTSRLEAFLHTFRPNQRVLRPLKGSKPSPYNCLKVATPTLGGLTGWVFNVTGPQKADCDPLPPSVSNCMTLTQTLWGGGSATIRISPPLLLGQTFRGVQPPTGVEAACICCGGPARPNVLTRGPFSQPSCTHGGGFPAQQPAVSPTAS